MPEEIRQYKNLGGRTLFIFIIKRSGLVFLLALLTVAAFVAGPFVPGQYSNYPTWAGLIFLAVFFALAVLVILIGWLEYSRYSIIIDGESIKINRGIIREEQVGIPFRRIEEVTIQRSIFEQFLGISNLVLEVLGDDNEKTSLDETRFVLPALDKKIALEMQDLMLKEAEVEEMSINK